MIKPLEARERAIRFFSKDIWTVDETTLTPGRRLSIRALKWLALLFRGFREDHIMLRASALTYTTVLSIVPFLAVAFALLKGFGFQRTSFIRDLLLRVSAGRVEIVDKIIEYIENTNVATLGMVGTSMLLITVISLLSNIEGSFNSIWRATRGRPLARKITEYISLSLVFPLLIVTAISITATMESSSIVQHMRQYWLIGEFYLFALNLAPYIAIWLAFSFIYFYIPNVKVKFLPALAGGVIAGIIWQVAQELYISFQFGAAKAGAIYGSFAQLPLFLVWVYLSWVIILLGAEMAYCFQNLRSNEMEGKYNQISPREQQHLGIALLVQLTRNMRQASSPSPSLDQLSDDLDIPATLARETLDILEQHNIVGRLETDDAEDEHYTLLRDPTQLTLTSILDIFLRHNEAQLTRKVETTHPEVLRSLTKMDACVTDNLGQLTIGDLEKSGALPHTPPGG